MTEVDRIVDQLERAFQGDPWYGSSVIATLAGVSPETAAAFPVRGAHSIWELVLHMTGWKNEVRARLGGALAGEPPAGDWPSQPKRPTAAAWAAALADLQHAHDHLVSAVRRTSGAHLNGSVRDERSRPLGTGLTHWQTLHGIIQHDVYHLGQISLLRKAIGA